MLRLDAVDPQIGTTTVRDWRVLSGTSVGVDREHLIARGDSRCIAADARLWSGTVTVQATLDAGSGFGVWLRTDVDEHGAVTSGWTVQVDPGWNNGALLIRTWYDDWEAYPVAIINAKRDTLFGSHRLVANIAGDVLHATWGDAMVSVDLHTARYRLGPRWAGVDGTAVGLRTWGPTELDVTSVEVTAVEVTSVEAAAMEVRPPRM